MEVEYIFYCYLVSNPIEHNMASFISVHSIFHNPTTIRLGILQDINNAIQSFRQTRTPVLPRELAHKAGRFHLCNMIVVDSCRHQSTGRADPSCISHILRPSCMIRADKDISDTISFFLIPPQYPVLCLVIFFVIFPHSGTLGPHSRVDILRSAV